MSHINFGCTSLKIIGLLRHSVVLSESVSMHVGKRPCLTSPSLRSRQYGSSYPRSSLRRSPGGQAGSFKPRCTVSWSNTKIALFRALCFRCSSLTCSKVSHKTFSLSLLQQHLTGDDETTEYICLRSHCLSKIVEKRSWQTARKNAS